jgi:hypothetical protein
MTKDIVNAVLGATVNTLDEVPGEKKLSAARKPLV